MQTTSLVIGCDEAGRGAWASSVVAACVWIADEKTRQELIAAGVRDSKKMSPSKRLRLWNLIKSHPSVKYTVGVVDAKEIDRVNIRNATFLAMTDATRDMQALLTRAHSGTANLIWDVRIDGNELPPDLDDGSATAIVGGDDKETCISAASIVAKTFRDRTMKAIDSLYPGYGFAQHKGYGVPAHMAALRRLGVSDIHRKSYAPIRALVQK